MASYLQGVTDFIPEVQPFAPDFNFYSGSLQMSQNKYDAAKQQISSVYGSLLNAPLTRSSNIEAREKFFKTIDNDIKKVSGLDLSLQQNVTAASGLFNQMLDNKNIAGDMVWTKQFQGQVGKGKALKGCANAEKCGGSWWQGGDQLMQYAQRDYQNATDEEARNMGVPDYVAYQDITKKAMALAKEADLNVKMDQKSGGYIITTQNGPLVMQSLADLFQGSLSKDPMIKEYYNAQAKLQRRNYMTTNAEKHGSEEAAEQAYITEKTEAIESLYKSMGQNLESNIEHEGKKAEQLEEKKAEATPDRAKSLDEALGRVRNRQAALAESNNVATENNDQIALAKKTNNYTGYQMDAAIAGINLSTDINKNAEILAYKDYEQTMKEDPYSMEAVKQSNRLSLADRKFEYDMKKIEYKSKLDAYYDGGGGGSGGKGGLGNGLGNDPVNEQVAGSTENTLASENNKYGQGDMLWGSEYEKDLESGYNLFTDDRRELKKDLSADQRVLSNQIVETTRRAADGGDAQAQEDYINLFNQHVSATGKGTKLNSTNINQAYKQARSSGIDITNMESGTLASYYDNVMEGYINPSKNSNKDTRSYLSPIWEGGQELISNINTSNQYLGEMNKFFAQDANTSFSKALAKGDITDAMYKSLVAYIDPETGEARGKADYLAAGGIADLYREDKRLTTAQKYNSDTGKIEDSYWEGTKNVASAGVDAVGTTALGVAELAKDSFLTAIGSGWLWGDGQDFFDRGFEYDDSGDAANWGGTNETDDWRNDDSKKGAPGVVDEMKRVFSKYAEPRGAQGWQGLKGTGNKAAQGSTFQQVDVANVRDLGVQGMKSVLSDALPDASAIFNFGGFKESATDDDKSARMIMMNLLQDSHAQIKGEKRFRGQMTFTPIANSNGEQYGMNVKFNQQYLNQYKGTEAYPGSVSEESWTTLMNDGITVYQNKANSNNVLLQGTQKSSAEISMDWTGSIPYEAYPRYAKNVKTSKSQNGYLTTGEWMTGLDANGLPMYEPYSIPHQASQNLNDIIKEVDKTILESVQMNRQIEQQWVTNNKK
tara:strand:- start:17493 stop:20651 length:3159 start_codon:yes stop_codon:yes gene_type:complete